MTVIKNLICSQCKLEHLYGNPFKHDSEFNLICSTCDNPLFAVSEKADLKIRKEIGRNVNTLSYQPNHKKELLPVIGGQVVSGESDGEDDEGTTTWGNHCGC